MAIINPEKHDINTQPKPVELTPDELAILEKYREDIKGRGEVKKDKKGRKGVIGATAGSLATLLVAGGGYLLANNGDKEPTEPTPTTTSEVTPEPTTPAETSASPSVDPAEATPTETDSLEVGQFAGFEGEVVLTPSLSHEQMQSMSLEQYLTETSPADRASFLVQWLKDTTAHEYSSVLGNYFPNSSNDPTLTLPEAVAPDAEYTQGMYVLAQNQVIAREAFTAGGLDAEKAMGAMYYLTTDPTDPTQPNEIILSDLQQFEVAVGPQTSTQFDYEGEQQGWTANELADGSIVYSKSVDVISPDGQSLTATCYHVPVNVSGEEYIFFQCNYSAR